MKMTLEKRILLFSFLILFLTIFIGSGMDIMALRKDQVNALSLRSKGLAVALKSNIEKVINLGLELKDMTGVSEKCREIIEGNPDIAYCMVTELNGKVLFASDPRFMAMPIQESQKEETRLGEEPVYKRRISMTVDGSTNSYYDNAVMVMSPYGKPLAQAHVGFSEQVVFDKMKGMVLKTLFLLAISLVTSFTLIMLFMKRYVMQPISVLLKGVKQISEGAFDTHIGEVQVYEFNELARNVNIMSQFLKNRDAEIKKNYQDMERTFDELQASYRKLEKLSTDLERSEELYKSLMEDASDAIVVIGADESIRMVNKMAEEFFGYEAKELVGLPLTKMLLLLNISNIPKVHRIFREAAEGAHIAEEMQLSRKEGGAMVAMLHASSIKSGSETLVQAIFRDVTREREIILNLEKSSADLARLNRMKDSFLGLASHELKTPLTVIMGYSELITTDLADKVDKTVLEMVVNIANAAARLDNIIKDMVDVSMIDEKRLQLKVEDIQLNRLIEASVNELRFFFSMRKQEVVLNLDESLPSIRGDALRLMQLLSNILGNAIKFTPDGGRITVSSSAKYLLRGPSGRGEGREHHLFLEITVTDTGIGIDREDQVRVFDKFYEVGNIQEHSSGKVAFKAKGAGLGLSIAKGIVDMHGGEIWVESTGYNPERFPGSTFHILLPVAPGLNEGSTDYSRLLR
ncbi:PAS domain S-box protein [Geomonas sp. Red69]|uniref:histidine kinase n=1 Tax=Geomonas diazotrophica TaxID=2843197 RepID=A0ABX8JSG5_9BACT|nr:MULTISPECIES: ATP-binding protein [Geomonas]MBU5637244.1 PAS domain S-box protein [Geomonas diazotrophica]QWV99537.1 PAS domain S-box protein [Geomonas nitrogeniifigens]QXE88712.1 PAS domain S-box protein [Geomonas nitrogeniifigens]